MRIIQMLELECPLQGGILLGIEEGQADVGLGIQVDLFSALENSRTRDGCSGADSTSDLACR